MYYEERIFVMGTSDNKSLHEGHRQRLKNKFLENGFQGFEPHNILELLLFYSIPRKDTNEIAHRLLNEFGSLKNVFNANFEDLIKVNGISENSATLIKMLPLIAKEYTDASFKEVPVFDTAQKIGEFFVNKYVGEKNEIVYAMLLSNKFELLSLVKVHEGSVNSAWVSTRKILDAVVKHNAPMLVLAHNHPEGTVCPSMDDINTTASLSSAFETFDIKLVEHFVVAGNEFCPIVRSSTTFNANTPESKSLFKRTANLKY